MPKLTRSKITLSVEMLEKAMKLPDNAKIGRVFQDDINQIHVVIVSDARHGTDEFIVRDIKDIGKHYKRVRR